jgi:hypothetical protein
MFGFPLKPKPGEAISQNAMGSLRAGGLLVIAILVIVVLYFIGAVLIKNPSHQP